MIPKQRAAPAPDSGRTDTLDEKDVVPLATAYQAGELIGERYRLLRPLGEGGMGVVWVARNLTLESEVAIKMLRAGEKSEKLERRMLKEAQAVARLGHPAILRVFDFGTTRLGDPYIVMELLDGEDLARTLERNGRLSPVKATRTLLPILHALATAHQKGIIHRDLKPDNIFVASTDGGYVQPKLVDFGIVKTEAPEVDRLTHLGTVLGTPAYLSPEQARGEDVDLRSDVWSAAVVLYEMVTCRLPFDGVNYNALLRSIIEDTPPPITNFGVGDAALWAIIERGLAKRAVDRWPNMTAFGSALADWLLARGESNDISGASLRAAWYQAPAVVRPEDLYSGHPAAAARPPGAALPAPVIIAAPRVPELPALAACGAAPPRLALGRRVWMICGAAALVLAFGAFQLSSALGRPPETPPLLERELSEPESSRRSEPTPGSLPANAVTAEADGPGAVEAAAQPAVKPVTAIEPHVEPPQLAPAQRSAAPVPPPAVKSKRSRSTAPRLANDLKTTL